MKAYQTDVRMFFEEMQLGKLDLDQLEELAACWLNKYRQVLSAKTTQRRLTSARCLGRSFGLVILKEYAAPTAATPIPHPLPRLEDDLEALLSVAETENDRVLLTLLGRFGLRISEARAVTPIDFNLHDMMLGVVGKGEKGRNIPVSPRAWELLCPIVVERITGGNGTLTITSISDRNARDRISKLGMRAGITRPISSHDLRATFATITYNRTKDISVVRDLLGHASVTQTQIYLGVSVNAMRAAVNFGGDDD